MNYADADQTTKLFIAAQYCKLATSGQLSLIAFDPFLEYCLLHTLRAIPN